MDAPWAHVRHSSDYCRCSMQIQSLISNETDLENVQSGWVLNYSSLFKWRDESGSVGHSQSRITSLWVIRGKSRN